MALALTADEIKKVDENRQTPTPTVFSAVTGTDVPISLDFEAYLILLSDSLKDEIIQQLKTVNQNNDTRKDRDELLSMALTSDIADAQNRFTLLESDLQTFTDFRDKISVEGFEAVSEIGVVLDDLQIAFGEDLLTLDRMQHLDTFLSLVEKSFKAGNVSDNTLKEVDSYIVLINSYMGLT
jgi:hypothetical protein